MDRRNDTAVEAILEQLIETGPTDIASVFARAFELAMQIERQRFLGAGHYERTPERRGYANATLPKRIDTRLAIDRDHVAVLQQGRHVGKNLSEGGVQRLGVDHAKDVREGVMRWNRMLQLQEVPEKTFFCSPKRRHLRAGTRAAEYRDEGDREQLAKVMPRVARARIGNVLEGGQEDLHRRKGSKRSPYTTKSNLGSDASNPNHAAVSKSDSPGPCATMTT